MKTGDDRFSVVYESETVLVSADLRPTSSVVIGMSPMRENAKVVRFGDGLVQRFGYSAVFVTAKADHWWQIEDRDRLCDAVRRASAHYAQRIAYGVSMGAYGALSLGADMGCGRVVAVAPQTVLTDPTAPLHHGWRALLSRRPILRDDVATDLRRIAPEIVYDPLEETDAAQVDYLAARKPVVRRPLPFAGHKVLRTLLECGILTDATRRLLAGDHGDLIRDYRATRGRSQNCLLNVGLTLCRRRRWDGSLKVVDELARRGHPELAQTLKVIVTKRRAKTARLA